MNVLYLYNYLTLFADMSWSHCFVCHLCCFFLVHSASHSFWYQGFFLLVFLRWIKKPLGSGFSDFSGATGGVAKHPEDLGYMLEPNDVI